MGPLRAFLYSLVFVLGLAITFTALGMAAALAGTIYGDVSSDLELDRGRGLPGDGAAPDGGAQVHHPDAAAVQPKTRGVVGAFLMGLLFGVVSAPCAAPILVVLLTYLAGGPGPRWPTARCCCWSTRWATAC